ncbi:hypothetical protein ACN08P_23110 (plasmid) [Photobacterium leiognathi subsp. mandapamensis]|uniref:hypothetical protein n=1 Tax=Photobacterium leiognathi TaxID=553611 RepID=UPI003AF3AB66
MNIPDFPLPSDMTTVIKFRVPTVADCMSFAELDINYEEQLTTQYLNMIQVGDINDAGNWTGEDRRTALWWIFISTREDKSIVYSYHCDICNEDHYPSIDMTSLGETAVTINGQPYRDIEFSHDGKVIKANVHPLTGYSLEHLEQLKNVRDSHTQGTVPYRKAANELSLYEMLHSFDTENQPEDKNEALAFKRQLVETMAVDSEFRPLAAKIEMALRQMRHGLLSKYKDGGYLLLAKRKPCAEEGDQLMPILIPFHASTFIPGL